MIDPPPEDPPEPPGDAPVVEPEPLLPPAPAFDPPDPAGMAGLADLPEDVPLPRSNYGSKIGGHFSTAFQG